MTSIDNGNDNRIDNGGRQQNNGVVYGYPWWPFSSGWSGNSQYDSWNGGNYGAGSSSVGYGGRVANNQGNQGPAGPATPVAPDQPAPGRAAEREGPTAAGAAAQVKNAVENSPSMAAANADVQRAQSAYEAAKQQVLEQLRKRPEYQLAAARRQQADQEVKATPAADPVQVAPAATAKLQAGGEVTRLETDALTADPAAGAAKAQLDELLAKREALRKQLIAGYQVQPGK